VHHVAKLVRKHLTQYMRQQQHSSTYSGDWWFRRKDRISTDKHGTQQVGDFVSQQFAPQQHLIMRATLAARTHWP
jgi:hypothetical protein